MGFPCQGSHRLLRRTSYQCVPRFVNTSNISVLDTPKGELRIFFFQICISQFPTKTCSAFQDPPIWYFPLWMLLGHLLNTPFYHLWITCENDLSQSTQLEKGVKIPGSWMQMRIREMPKCTPPIQKVGPASVRHCYGMDALRELWTKSFDGHSDVMNFGGENDILHSKANFVVF